jgi:hypothetical protein
MRYSCSDRLPLLRAQLLTRRRRSRLRLAKRLEAQLGEMPDQFGVTSIRCPFLAGSFVDETSGVRHSEERNEEINDEQDFHDTVRC